MIRYLYMSLIAQGLLVACIAIPARQALGGIMLASVPEASYINFSNQSQFDAIGTFSPGASGTLIAPNWVLTAGHLGVNVNNFRVRGTGQSYAVAEVVQHPTFIVNNQNINLGYDIQLVRLWRTCLTLPRLRSIAVISKSVLRLRSQALARRVWRHR